MKRRRREKKAVNFTLREEALRPSRKLGYNHDSMGLYLMEREAYAIAESEFRRAMWLNPDELSFQVHLAWCFSKQGNLPEALKLIDQVLMLNPDYAEAESIGTIIFRKNKDKSDP